VQKNLSNDPKEIVAEHLGILRLYAGKVFKDGKQLSGEEEADKAVRIREMFAIGASFNLTRGEVAGMILNHAFPRIAKCACPTCRAREQNQKGN
jgi:hypothetical protein